MKSANLVNQNIFKEMKLDSFQGMRFCNENLPTKMMLGVKEVKDSKLRLRGWFLSPYFKLAMKIEYSSGEIFYICFFDARDEVVLKYPEYKQKGRGFFFEEAISDMVRSIRISLMLDKKEVYFEKFYRNENSLSKNY